MCCQGAHAFAPNLSLGGDAKHGVARLRAFLDPLTIKVHARPRPPPTSCRGLGMSLFPLTGHLGMIQKHLDHPNDLPLGEFKPIG